MFRSRILARVCLLALALVQSSCALSENPLSDPDKAKVDERLFGQWKFIDKDKGGGTTHVFFGKPGKSEFVGVPAGLTVAHEVTFSADSEVTSRGNPNMF